MKTKLFSTKFEDLLNDSSWFYGENLWKNHRRQGLELINITFWGRGYEVVILNFRLSFSYGFALWQRSKSGKTILFPGIYYKFFRRP